MYSAIVRTFVQRFAEPDAARLALIMHQSRSVVVVLYAGQIHRLRTIGALELFVCQRLNLRPMPVRSTAIYFYQAAEQSSAFITADVPHNETLGRSFVCKSKKATDLVSCSAV